MIVPKNKRRAPTSTSRSPTGLGGEYAAESCSTSGSMAAHEIITSQKIPAREGYTVVSLK